MIMRYRIFSDESGIHDGSPCYAIGALVLSDDQLVAFEQKVCGIIQKHQVDKDELAWNYIGEDGTHHEASLEVMDLVVRHGYRFHAMVVKKDIFEHFRRSGFEQAFYRTYRILFKHIAGIRSGRYDAVIDGRDDHYKRHPEAVLTITNHMLTQIASESNFATVTKAESVHNLSIQVADLLTGAICSSTANLLDSRVPINKAKQDIISRFAHVLGWPDLAGDTYPKERLFNIWHFPNDPPGFRGWPESRAIRRPLSLLPVPLRRHTKPSQAESGADTAAG